MEFPFSHASVFKDLNRVTILVMDFLYDPNMTSVADQKSTPNSACGKLAVGQNNHTITFVVDVEKRSSPIWEAGILKLYCLDYS